MELFVFMVAAVACLSGAIGVVFSRNPVHAALSLVGTLFGIAVLFVAQEANFLAAVQVIVYAGAIVVLFLFVLMLLGVDRAEDLRIEPLGGQRISALVVGLAVLGLTLMAFLSTSGEATGERPKAASVSAEGVATEADPNRISGTAPDIDQLGESLFTDYLFAFEATSALLVIAVVGAVVLSRKVKRADLVDDPLVEADRLEREAAALPTTDTDAADDAADDSEPPAEPEPEAQEAEA
jgi:NADH-quinone oxidoreductase subunit J